MEDAQKSSIIKAFFMPDSSLQGTDFPIHLIWDENRAVNIKIYIPLNIIELKEIYNVDETELEIGETHLSITNFERNGYVGFVFFSKIYKEPFVEIPIKIECSLCSMAIK